MTALKCDKPLTRKTAALYRSRALVVSLHSRHLEIRPERQRESFTIDYYTLYELAMKIHARRTPEI
jgi:hypothetical protein